MSDWTFLTNHAHVLLAIARDPGIRIEEIATTVGFKPRAAHRVVTDLVEAGYLDREKVGRRNRYQIHAERPLRHDMERDHAIGELLGLLGPPPGSLRPLPGLDGP